MYLPLLKWKRRCFSNNQKITLYSHIVPAKESEHTSLIEGFLDIITFVLVFLNLYEKGKISYIVLFHNMAILTRSRAWTPAPRSSNFTILVESFTSLPCILFFFLIYMGVGKNICKKIIIIWSGSWALGDGKVISFII